MAGCPRTSLKPMSMKDLFALPKGGRFIVYYAKDDNPERVRFDFEERKVAVVDGTGIVDDGGEDWQCDSGTVPDDSDNLYDTSRGYAYFFHPEAR